VAYLDYTPPTDDDWDAEDVRRYLASIGRSGDWEKFEYYKATGRLQMTFQGCLNGSPVRMDLPPPIFADHGFPTIHGNLTDGRITVSARAVRQLFPPPAAATADTTPPALERQRLIKQLAEEEFPDGYEAEKPATVRQRVSKRLEKMKKRVPGRDTLNRALGYRRK
jgi:hypothetical protein